MTDTANLGLPFIDGSQAQKHVTHNEALRILDAAIQIGVLDVTRTAPPSSPVDGERHVVAASPTGAWAGQANRIATYEDGAWRFLVPKLGWTAWCDADEVLFVYDGTAWRDQRDLPVSIDTVSHLGINATATSPNLLCVKSNAALFNAIAVADGGTGDARVQISRESSAKTASVVFSDAFSGRAEFGLVGSNAFKLKVSNDGSTFVEAFNIDQTSGNLSLPRGVLLTGVSSPSQITSAQNDYAPTGFASAGVLRISTDASRNITGLAGGAEGRAICVVNAGANPVVLKDENAGSTAANRFGFGNDLTLAAKQGATLIYDGNASRWRQVGGPSASTGGAGATDSERQNALLAMIYQSKSFAEYRRLVNIFATGFKGASDTLNGIVTGSSSNYTVTPGTAGAATGNVAPTVGSGTTVTMGTVSTAQGFGGYTYLDRTNAVVNSQTINSIGVYSSSALSFTVKVVLRNSSGNYTVAVSQAASHPGGGWVDFALSSPFAVPGSGTYYVGVYCSGASAGTPSSARSVISGDATGTAGGWTEDTGPVPNVRYTYGIAPANMTVVTALQAADTTVSNARALIEYDGAASPAPNTDLTLELTCNGGANWTSATLSAVTSYSQAGRRVAETADAACTPGTSFAARIKTLTNKNVPVYGVCVTAR